MTNSWNSLRGKGVIGLVLATLAGCTGKGPDTPAGTEPASADTNDWIVLIDGENGLDRFNQVGVEANWTAMDGAIQATSGGSEPSFLVSKQSFSDFELRVEFWASHDANSGIFLRCAEPDTVSEVLCYEVNIFDERPDPRYGTGGIVNLAEAPYPMPKAGEKWNTYEITADGPHLRVVLNGKPTVELDNDSKSSGPIALQWGSGTMRFRSVKIREL